MATPAGEQPLGQALVICDSVIDDITTRKKSLIGIFSMIRARSFPVQHPKMCVYASMTNGRGQVHTTLRCVRIIDDFEVMSVSGDVQFPGPNDVVDMVFNLAGVVFEQPGVYSFELRAMNEILLEKRFSVSEVKS